MRYFGGDRSARGGKGYLGGSSSARVQRGAPAVWLGDLVKGGDWRGFTRGGVATLPIVRSAAGLW